MVNNELPLIDIPDCIVCLDELKSRICVIPCGHAFHLECITKFISQSRSSCPTCRKAFCSSQKINMIYEVKKDPLLEINHDSKSLNEENSVKENNNIISILKSKCASYKNHNVELLRKMDDLTTRVDNLQGKYNEALLQVKTSNEKITNFFNNRIQANIKAHYKTDEYAKMKEKMRKLKEKNDKLVYDIGLLKDKYIELSDLNCLLGTICEDTQDENTKLGREINFTTTNKRFMSNNCQTSSSKDTRQLCEMFLKSKRKRFPDFLDLTESKEIDLFCNTDKQEDFTLANRDINQRKLEQSQKKKKKLLSYVKQPTIDLPASINKKARRKNSIIEIIDLNSSSENAISQTSEENLRPHQILKCYKQLQINFQRK